MLRTLMQQEVTTNQALTPPHGRPRAPAAALRNAQAQEATLLLAALCSAASEWHERVQVAHAFASFIFLATQAPAAWAQVSPFMSMDDLRREARRLEHTLDAELMQLGRSDLSDPGASSGGVEARTRDVQARPLSVRGSMWRRADAFRLVSAGITDTAAGGQRRDEPGG